MDTPFTNRKDGLLRVTTDRKDKPEATDLTDFKRLAVPCVPDYGPRYQSQLQERYTAF
jgi:hypothetical protein